MYYYAMERFCCRSQKYQLEYPIKYGMQDLVKTSYLGTLKIEVSCSLGFGFICLEK